MNEDDYCLKCRFRYTRWCWLFGCIGPSPDSVPWNAFATWSSWMEDMGDVHMLSALIQIYRGFLNKVKYFEIHHRPDTVTD